MLRYPKAPHRRDRYGQNFRYESGKAIPSGTKASQHREVNYARHAEEMLRTSSLLDVISDAVLVTDNRARVTYMNRAAELLTGISLQYAIGRPLEKTFKVLDAITRLSRKNQAKHVIVTGNAVSMHNSGLLMTPENQEVSIEDSATPLYDENKEIVGVMIVFHDTRYTREATAKMTYLAQHDPLTGLLNRYAFTERFEQSAALALRHDKKMVLLFIDLDNFKELNDTLGHSNGDLVLKKLSHEMLTCIRVTDHICRFGGDEFVVLLSDIEKPEQAFSVVDKIRAAANDLMTLNGQPISLQLSIGVSIFPDHGESLEALIPHADAAMYRVKSTKPGNQKTL
jgi:diguanylate cyclase (GGDEF)-like protein/PAS domain S-box-containing protein